jgi:probable phosphoglycerate mutase
MAMRLVLIRHGEARRGEPGSEDGLTERGRAQAAVLAAPLRALAPSRVLASPTPRATETATVAGLVFEVAEVFEKFHYGDGEVQERRDAEAPLWRPEDRASPSGESLREFHERVARGLDALAATSAGATVVLVAHGGVVLMALRWAMGLSKDAVWVGDITVPNASITEMTWTRGTSETPAMTVVSRVGDTRHLPRELL